MWCLIFFKKEDWCIVRRIIPAVLNKHGLIPIHTRKHNKCRFEHYFFGTSLFIFVHGFVHVEIWFKSTQKLSSYCVRISTQTKNSIIKSFSQKAQHSLENTEADCFCFLGTSFVLKTQQRCTSILKAKTSKDRKIE